MLREEIERKPKFNYLNISKKVLNKDPTESPNKLQDCESEIKLQNLACESLEYSVREKPARIGSSPSAPIRLASPDIQAFHSEIYYRDEAFFFRDLKSSSGSWLRVLPEKPFLLRAGVEFTVEIGRGTHRLKAGTTSVEHHFNQERQRLQLTEEVPVTIGKAEGCTLKFPNDSCISKVHCRIIRRNGDVFLEDAKSTNGTWLSVDSEEGLLLGERMELRIGAEQSLKVLSVFVKTEQKEGKKCLSCKAEDAKTIVEPCHHVALCGACVKTVRNCPECGSVIDKIIITG